MRFWRRRRKLEERPLEAWITFGSSGSDRLPDCSSCGGARVLSRGRLASDGVLPKGVQLVTDGISCPWCGELIWEPRQLTAGDENVIAWQLCASTTAELEARAREDVTSYEEQARLEYEAELAYWERVQAEQSARFAEQDRNNNNEGERNE